MASRRWSESEAGRGFALFFGGFSAANAIVAMIARRSEDLWWIDYGIVGPWLGALTGLLAAALMIAFGLAPAMGERRRFLTASAMATLCAVAASNAVAFYGAWADGGVRPGVPVPLSALLACTFLWLTWVVWHYQRRDSKTRPWMTAAAVTLLLAFVFPLLQVAFFGTTDYRRHAAVTVVLGARVHDDGTLSTSLADRVRTGAELYRTGLTRRLVMSGGVGPNGIDEAAAMRDFAVSLGVPSEAIAIDSGGVSTDATVRDTCALIGANERIMVVSQFYHLPRIKLAYRAAGRDVLTVPASESQPIPKTPLFVVREVPGFWVYWARSACRDLGL